MSEERVACRHEMAARGEIIGYRGGVVASVMGYINVPGIIVFVENQSRLPENKKKSLVKSAPTMR